MITTTSTLFDVLAGVPVLAGLNMTALTLLAGEGKVLDFNAGDLIVREGAAGHSFFIIAQGEVEVIKHLDSPRPTLLAKLHRGTFFGEMCVVDPVPRAATVRALTPVTAIEITAGTLHHLFQKMPNQYAIVILNLARDMARRLRTLDEAFAARAS